MTYLDWGCDTLADECQSCLDAICNACHEGWKKNHNRSCMEGLEEIGSEADEPDCDQCDPEKKTDCPHCEIIGRVCRECSRNATCEFRISG